MDVLLAQTSGNDTFYRNPYNVEENLFVNITSPSSSKYESVDDFGTPDQVCDPSSHSYHFPDLLLIVYSGYIDLSYEHQ